MANNSPISTSEPPATTLSDKKSIKISCEIDAFSLKMAGIFYLILGIAFAASAQTVRRESFSFQDHVYHVSLWPVHTVMAAGAVWGGIYAIGDEQKKHPNDDLVHHHRAPTSEAFLFTSTPDTALSNYL